MLAELNKVQERNNNLQEKLSICTYENQQLSRQKNIMEDAHDEAISHCENLSVDRLIRLVFSICKKKIRKGIMNIYKSFQTLLQNTQIVKTVI